MRVCDKKNLQSRLRTTRFIWVKETTIYKFYVILHQYVWVFMVEVLHPHHFKFVKKKSLRNNL